MPAQPTVAALGIARVGFAQFHLARWREAERAAVEAVPVCAVVRNRRVLSADLLALRRDDDTPLADRREREHARLVGEHLGRKLGRLDRSDEHVRRLLRHVSQLVDAECLRVRLGEVQLPLRCAVADKRERNVALHAAEVSAPRRVAEARDRSSHLRLAPQRGRRSLVRTVDDAQDVGERHDHLADRFDIDTRVRRRRRRAPARRAADDFPLAFDDAATLALREWPRATPAAWALVARVGTPVFTAPHAVALSAVRAAAARAADLAWLGSQFAVSVAVREHEETTWL